MNTDPKVGFTEAMWYRAIFHCGAHDNVAGAEAARVMNDLDKDKCLKAFRDGQQEKLSGNYVCSCPECR